MPEMVAPRALVFRSLVKENAALGMRLSFLGMLCNENPFGGRVHGFFVSIHLIPASQVLDIYECLGIEERKMKF